MELESSQRGYAVMSENLKSISISGYNIESLKQYCRPGYVIAERIPAIYGFSIRIVWHKWHRPLHFKYSLKNILWLHWQVSKEYFHKTGRIVYRPPVAGNK